MSRRSSPSPTMSRVARSPRESAVATRSGRSFWAASRPTNSRRSGRSWPASGAVRGPVKNSSATPLGITRTRGAGTPYRRLTSSPCSGERAITAPARRSSQPSIRRLYQAKTNPHRPDVGVSMWKCATSGRRPSQATRVAVTSLHTWLMCRWITACRLSRQSRQGRLGMNGVCANSRARSRCTVGISGAATGCSPAAPSAPRSDVRTVTVRPRRVSSREMLLAQNSTPPTCGG